jgi:hypothetical protein
MNKNVEYECTRNIYTEIERCPVGTCKISIHPDTYEEDDDFTLAEADILLILHKNSPLTLAVLIFKQPSFDVTMLVDLVSTGHLLIENDGQCENIVEHFKTKYNCSAVGEGKTLVCTAEKPDADLASMLSGEMYESTKVSYKLRPESLERERTENLAQYDFYECYASKRTVIYVLPKMRGRAFSENIEDEAAMVFIMELLLFRHNAIESASSDVLSSLAKTQILQLKDIEKLYVGFGHTLIFWEKENYKYAGAQRLADSIAKRFELDAEEEGFYRKFEQIEHIVELHRSQENEKDSKKNENDSKNVNKILITLAVLQVVLIVTQIILGLIEIIDLPIWAWVSLLLLCLIAMGVIPIFFIRGRRKQND